MNACTQVTSMPLKCEYQAKGSAECFLSICLCENFYTSIYLSIYLCEDYYTALVLKPQTRTAQLPTGKIIGGDWKFGDMGALGALKP